MVHREMKVLKELLGKHLSILAILECVHLVLSEKHQAHPAAHTNSWGLLKLRGKEQILLWFCGAHAALVQWHRLSLCRLCPVSSIPHKAQVTSRWHELTATVAIRARTELCRYMWIWISESLLFSPPCRGKGFPIPHLCTALSTSFPSGWRCTNAEAPAGSHSIVLNIVFQPSWTGGASRLQHKPQGFMDTLALPASRAPAPALVLEQGWLLEQGQPGSRAGSWNPASCCAPGVLFGFADTASFHSTQTNGETLPGSLMRQGLLLKPSHTHPVLH